MSDEIILKNIANFLIDNNVTEITRDITERFARINENINQKEALTTLENGLDLNNDDVKKLSM